MISFHTKGGINFFNIVVSILLMALFFAIIISELIVTEMSPYQQLKFLRLPLFVITIMIYNRYMIGFLCMPIDESKLSEINELSNSFPEVKLSLQKLFKIRDVVYDCDYDAIKVLVKDLRLHKLKKDVLNEE
jgi:hypothetical protein